MHESISRTISTLAIWVSTAYILVAGAFRANWYTEGMHLLPVVIGLICAAAVAGTAFVWVPRRAKATAAQPAKVGEEDWATA